MHHSLKSYRGLDPYLFVSYSKESMELASSEITRLSGLGYRLWHEGGVSPGRERGVEIEEAIKNCEQLVVLVTKKFAEYALARKQISLALKHNIPILTIFLEPAQLTHGLDFLIGDLQSLKKYERSSSEFEDSLIDALSASARHGAPVAGEPLFSEQEHTTSTQQTIPTTGSKWSATTRFLVALVGFVASIITIWVFVKAYVPQKEESSVSGINQQVNVEEPVKKRTGQTKPEGLVAVSSLTFMDAQTKSTMVQTKAAQLINKAVHDGMVRATYAMPQLRNNDPNYRIPDNDENVNKLVNFFFDPGMTSDEKVQGIFIEMMDPNQVDVIVSGQYIDEANKAWVTVRPFIIVKDGRKLATRNLQFSRDKLFCEDPDNPGGKMLCTSAHDDIAQAVRELLELSVVDSINAWMEEYIGDLFEKRKKLHQRNLYL